MRRLVGIIALLGVIANFSVWTMMIFTGACFDGSGFSDWVPVIFLGFVTSLIIAIACWAKDVLCFVGKCLGLRED